MMSGASESALNEHLTEFIRDARRSLDTMSRHSWQNVIHTSWDENERVEIRVDIKET